MLGRTMGVAVLFATLATLPVPGAAQSDVRRVPVSGVIEMGLAPFIGRAIMEAEAAGAAAVILDIETPGGRVDAAQRIVKFVLEAEIPVYALVNTHAWSAGALIALAADSIYMVPGSSIGAATPVYADGQKGSEKIVSAMRGEFRALAERRGLDPRIAEAMVDETIAVDGVVEAGRLLTLTPVEAIRLGLAAGEYDDLDALLTSLGLEQSTVVTAELNWAEHVVRFLSNPMVAPLLLSIGALAIFLELKTPTFGVAGLIGLVSFGAFFGSHLLVGLAGWEEVILLGAGLIALLLEVLVLPGFGIAGMIAILCIGTAIFLSLIGNIPTWNDFAIASSILAGSVMLVGLGLGLMIRYLPRTHRLQGVFLGTTTDRALGYIAAPERLDLIGLEGVALTDLRPSGTAQIGRERVDVVTQGEFIPQHSRIRIVQSEAYRHIVELADAEA